MMETDKIKVTYAVLCDKCERFIKEEEIIFLTNKQVQIEKANNPKGFFRSVNLKEKTEYRLISTETCSIC